MTWPAFGSFRIRYTSIHIDNRNNLNPCLYPRLSVFESESDRKYEKKITISTIFICIRSVYIPTKRRPSCRKQSPYATSCAGATASDWASLTKNRGPNRTNRELEPKEPKQRISILCSVQNSQESKFSSVQLLNSVNRETEPICNLTPQSPNDPSRRPIKSTF